MIEKVIDKIFVSKKITSSERKYIFGYKNNYYDINPLCIMLSKKSMYVRSWRWWFKKYNQIWDKVSNSIKKIFYRKPIYNDKYLKTKVKSYKDKIKTDVHDNKIPKEGFYYICLSMILIEYVL